ncbi:hypothetical protein [Klebsiella phage vB_KpnS-VAC35]|uniref:Uncharacterized protein n=4 Tax=Viruses TaxID=10239 RepID=A0AAE8YDL0_9CAUD|nr:hypothetical protein [Klebsiella phage vB_KpnS-VAC35]CAK6606729.1 hypothetical protein K7PH164C4_LOCUS125 [Klebsiella phage vB_Kpn_K7PH164C4]
MKSIDNYLRGENPVDQAAVTVEKVRKECFILTQRGGGNQPNRVYLNWIQSKDLYERLKKEFE